MIELQSETRLIGLDEDYQWIFKFGPAVASSFPSSDFSVEIFKTRSGVVYFV